MTLPQQNHSKYYSIRPKYFDAKDRIIMEFIDPNDPLFGDLQSVEPYEINSTTYSWNCNFASGAGDIIKEVLPNYDELNPWFLTPYQFNNRYEHISFGYWEDGTVNFEKLKLLSGIEWCSLDLLMKHIKFHIEEYYSMEDANIFHNITDRIIQSIDEQPILIHRRTYRVIPNVEESTLVGELIQYECIETTLIKL